jgi:hypothetical protein
MNLYSYGTLLQGQVVVRTFSVLLLAITTDITNNIHGAERFW